MHLSVGGLGGGGGGGVKNGLSVLHLLLKSSPLKVESSCRLVLVSDVSGFSSAAMDSRRFFNTGGVGGITTESPSLVKREPCDEKISSTKVLDQFPGLMIHGMVKKSKTRRLLRLNPGTGYFEEEQHVAAVAANHHSRHYELQVPHGHVCRGSAYGWLFLTDNNFDMKLFNPLSGAEIQLPPVKTLPPPWRLTKWFVGKAVFSANPSIEPRPVVLVIYGENEPRLAFCKPGDKGWTPLEFPNVGSFHMDTIYHKGQFYVLGHPGYVAAFDIGRRIDDDDHSVKTILVATAAKREDIFMRDWYLVMLDGELVRFELRQACFRECCIDETKELMEMEKERDGDTTDEYFSTDEDYETDEESDDDDGKKEKDRNDCCIDETKEILERESKRDGDSTADEDYCDEDYIDEKSDDEDDGKKDRKKENHGLDCVDQRLASLTYGIKIRRFDASEKQWVKMESLGDKAVFLGYNTSFALSASDYPAGVCIPDSIYFTYGRGGSHYTEQRCYDMGIYNVKDKSVKPLHPPMPMDDEDEAFPFIKPAPIWINVNSADR